MDKTQAFEKLQSIGQEHVLHYFNTLNDSLQKNLLKQIEALNISYFKIQQQMLKKETVTPKPSIAPYKDFSTRGDKEAEEIGKASIAEGRVGTLLIAGGQGTRLKSKGPKGACQVTRFKKKSLFQVFAEKTIAAGKRAKRTLPIAVMTSPQNHRETLAFFKQNDFFNLDNEQLYFFSQGMLPLLSEDGNLILGTKATIASGPDGNGTLFAHFLESGIWDVWHEMGVQVINCVLIDNPLADPFDAELIGHLEREERDLVVKCTRRERADEKVGVLGNHQNKLEVIEYTELGEDERGARDEAGELLYPLANLSLFCLRLNLAKQLGGMDLPLHLAKKAQCFVGSDGEECIPKQPNAWKFEKFIFDIFPLASKVKAILYPREECFSPLKNHSGEASLETVQEALLGRDHAILSEITGNPKPSFSIELSQDFYYPTEDLIRRWKGATVEHEGYVSAL